jgi:hypothetical protein
MSEQMWQLTLRWKLSSQWDKEECGDTYEKWTGTRVNNRQVYMLFLSKRIPA